MNSDTTLPPPFVVGQTYRDRQGEYTVIRTDENCVVIERADGRRDTADATLKARIHRNMATESADVGSRGIHRGRTRLQVTGRRKQLMLCILRIEADGADHSGIEIDRAIVAVASDLGFSDADILRLLPETGRTAFGNEGDWAKAKLTEYRLHEVVGRTAYCEGNIRRECNVYRITTAGLDELQRNG